MAKRIIKTAINWEELAKRVPPEQKVQFFAFKGKHEAYLQRMQINPPEPPKIDWEHYKKFVPVPGLVDKLQKEYQSFKVPFPTDTMSAEVDKQWQNLQSDIQKYKEEMNNTIESATKELNRLKSLPKYEDMTMEMYADMFPNDALDPVKRPTFWPHTPDEQLGYVDPMTQVQSDKKKH